MSDHRLVAGCTPLPLRRVQRNGYKICAAVGGWRLTSLLGTSSAADVDAEDFWYDPCEKGCPLVSRHPDVGAGQMR